MFKMTNKKSFTTLELIMWLAVVSLVAFVMLSFFRRTSSETGTFFSSETLGIKDSKCKFDTERASGKPLDSDKDGRADACDICVGISGKGNNDEDNDLDKMPDYCDKDSNDRTVIACKWTPTKDGRCVEGATVSK